jgi:hypothetical protein
MARQWLTLEGELARVLVQPLGPLAVEDLPELGDEMFEPAIVLGQRLCSVSAAMSASSASRRARSASKAARISGGRTERSSSGTVIAGETTLPRGACGVPARRLSHSAAAGGRTRRGP